MSIAEDFWDGEEIIKSTLRPLVAYIAGYTAIVVKYLYNSGSYVGLNDLLMSL